MHVCFTTYGPWQGNAGLLRPKGLGAALIDLGVEVTYLVDDMPANRGDLGLHPHARIAWVPRSRSAAQVVTRRQVLRKVAPDVVHLLNPHAKSLAAVGGRRGLRILADWDEPPVLRPFGPARMTLERALDVWLRRRADHHVACTKWLQERFRRLYDLDVAYIPHGTYLQAFEPSTSPFAEPTAVYLGSFLPQWDHDIVFEAARLLAEQGIKPPIAFVGDGPDRARWEAFAQRHELTNVRFLGWMEHAVLQRHLRHAHVALFPIRDTDLNRSRCPSKLFAYAQAGRPVIANRVGEVPEILGPAATYIEPTPAAFAAAIAEAMSQPDLPDVDFEPQRHAYADRARRMLAVLDEPERPLRVLVNGVAARIGGGGTYLREQAGALAALDGLELTIHATGDVADGLADRRNVRVVSHPRRPLPVRLLWEQVALAWESRRHDVVWSTGNFALLLTRRPQLLTAQNIWYFATPAPGSPRPALRFRVMTALQRPLARASVRRATHVVAVSGTMAGAMGARSNGHTTVVPNAAPQVEAAAASPAPAESYVLAVGHDLAHKDWERLIEAVAGDEQLPALVIAGDCSSARRAQLQARVAPGRLVLLGAVADRAELTALYRGARAVVVHSHLESFGLTACEALSLGCSVAASDIPAHREVCGGAAHLYDPSSVMALRAAVGQAVAAPPAALATWAWPHSWQSGARRLAAILHELGEPCAS
jgi:glycosyltransferase involved in cell wall biosynthesis